MADTIRQRIVDEVDKQFKKIKRTGGYKTDAGHHVFSWRDPPLDKRELPCIVYRDGIESIDIIDNSLESHTLPFEVDLIDLGDTAPAKVRELIADIIRALGVDPTWNGLAIDTRLTAAGLSTAEASRKIGQASVNFDVLYRTDVLNAEK